MRSTPEFKLYAFVSAATVGAMFILIKLVHFFDEIAKQFIPDSPLFHLFYFTAQGLLVIAGTFGTYRFISWGIIKLIDAGNFEWLKKKILGDYYLEGTWVGFYGKDSNIFYVVDKYEQEFSTYSVSGAGYKDAFPQRRASWRSTAGEFIADTRTLEFICTVTLYQPAGTKDKTTAARTTLTIQSAKGETPSLLTGESVNMSDNESLPVYLTRLPLGTYTDGDAFNKAKSFYNKQIGRAATSPPTTPPQPAAVPAKTASEVGQPGS